ncbi:MAG: hypothetical protein ACE5KA_05355 [Nitrososphaerales archaeon]
MSRKGKKSNYMKKIIGISIAGFLIVILIVSVVAVTYSPPAQEDDDAKAFLCGSGIPNSNRYVQEFLIPGECSEPVGITVDENGIVWFAQSAARKIGKFDPQTEQFSEFPLPDAKEQEKILPVASIWDMEFDKDGNLWFVDVVANAIWKFTPTRETFELFNIPTTTEFKTSYPINFNFDNEGNIWFSEIYGKKIGFLDTANARHETSEGIREFSASVDLETLGPLAFDNNGDIWFTALTYPVSGKLMKFNPQSTAFTTYDLPTGIASPVGIVIDRHGNLWINDHGTSAFFKLNPATNVLTTYVTSLPRPSTSLGLYEDCLTQPNGSSLTCAGLPVSLPYWNTIDKQGRIWFNVHQGNSMAVFDPGEETLIEYFVPTQNSEWGACEGYQDPCGIANPLQFSLAPDGKVWFTEWSENKIAVLNSNLPLPIELEIVDKHFDVSLGEDAKIELKVTAKEKLESDVEMRISGTIVPTGKLFNMRAHYSEQKLSFDEPSSKTVTLTLAPEEGLQSGEYRITVSAKYGALTYSKIVHLTMEPGKI